MEMYRIGEFAYQMGISTDALKHYEKYGLVNFIRNDDNGYRYCDFSQHLDIFTISSIRSSEKTLSLLRDHKLGLLSKDDFMEGLQTRKRELDNKLVFSKYELECVYNYLTMVVKNEEGVGIRNSRKIEGKKLYFLEYAVNYKFTDRTEDEIAECALWRAYAPVTKLARWLNHSNSYRKVSHGLCIDSTFADEYQLTRQFSESLEGNFVVLDLITPESELKEIRDVSEISLLTDFLAEHPIQFTDVLLLHQFYLCGYRYEEVYLHAE